MDNIKIFVYCHKSKGKRSKGLYSDVAVVKSNNIEEAKIILSKYFDDIDELIEVKFDDSKNIFILSDY